MDKYQTPIGEDMATLSVGELTARELDEVHREWVDSLQMTVHCSFCPDWSATGTASEVRLVAREHRQTVHPEITIAPRRRRRPPSNPARISNRALSEQERDDVESERQRRMRLLGIE